MSQDGTSSRTGTSRTGRRAAVIGAGFGGLAAAIRLQAAGFQTVLFEARDKPGGRAYRFEEDGFAFDAGPTVITAPECIEELFAVAGKDMSRYVELLPVEPFYRLLWWDGDRMDYGADHEALVAEIARRNPADVAGYERYLEHSKKVFEKGYGDLVATPFLKIRDMLAVAPDLLKLRADRPVYQTVASFISDERVRQALSFNSLLIGGHPFESSSIYTLIHHIEKTWGVWYPKGGTYALVDGLARLFQDLGGDLRLNDPVDRLRVEGSGRSARHYVTSTTAREEPFDLVVSNADLHHLYGKLLRGDRRAERMRRRLERMRWSMSIFLIYFGTDRTYPDLAQHSIIFGPRYKELIDQIFHGPSLADDFSLYLHAPCRTDPSLAPPGCDSFYVLSPVPHLGTVGTDWDREGERYAERILERLERFMPDLRKHIVVKRLFTPRDFERDLGAYLGNAFSVAPTLLQSAWFRPHNRDPRIPGLYIVGAGTHPGAGVPGVINTAKATMQVIAADYRL